MGRIEWLASDLRRQLGITGYPGLLGLHRLLEYLSEQVRFVPTPDREGGACWHREDGSCTIWADPQRPDTLGHETGHCLATVGLADWLAFNGVRTARREHWREERLAWQFARAFLLPAEPCQNRQLTDEDIADSSGCPEWMVRERRRELHCR